MSTQTDLLVEVADVVTRMQIDQSLVGLAEVVQSAILAAQLQVATVLDTILSKQQVTATFYVDRDAFSGVHPGGMYRLELPTGLVRTDVPLVLTVGELFNLSDQAPPADTTTYRVDLVRGIVYLQAAARLNPFTVGAGNIASAQLDYYGDQLVQVVYQSGFKGIVQDETQSPPVEITPAETIPDWLYEAILCFVPIIFDSSQVTNRNAEAATQAKRAADLGLAKLALYVRNKGMAFRPNDWFATPL